MNLRTLVFITVLCILVASTYQQISHCNQTGTRGDGTMICLDCEKGFYLDPAESEPVCKECQENCKQCTLSPVTGSKCLVCQNEYRLDQQNNDCVKCPDNCKTCNDKGKCTSCIDDSPVLTSGVCKSQTGMFSWLVIVVVLSVILIAGRFCYSSYFYDTPAEGDSNKIAYLQKDPSMPIKKFDKQFPSPTKK